MASYGIYFDPLAIIPTAVQLPYIAFNLKYTFSFSLWVLPIRQITLNPPSNSGVSGLTGQAYVINPVSGNLIPGIGNAAGVGLSVGTNGVSVYEHALFYFTPLLTYTPSALFTTWTYITVVYENCQPSIYINAVYQGTGLQSDYSAVFAPSELGSNINGNFVGSIDELRVYDRVLSAEEILANYNADLTYGI